MKSSAPPRCAASRILSLSCARAGLPSPIFSCICLCVRYVASEVCEDEAHGEGEVCVVLEEDGHGGTEVSQSESFDVSIIDEDGTFCWVVDAGDKFQDRTLSRAVCSDNDL
jgi:hypothetical protein